MFSKDKIQNNYKKIILFIVLFLVIVLNFFLINTITHNTSHERNIYLDKIDK